MQRSVRHRRIIGGAVKEFLNKANQFLKKTQLLSNVGSVLNITVVPMPLRPIGDKVIDYAKSRGRLWEKEDQTCSISFDAY